MNELSHKYEEKMIDSLQGILDEKDSKELGLWLNESSENQSDFELYKKIWHYTNHTKKEYDTEEALRKVNDRITSIESKNIYSKKQNWFVRNRAQITSVAAVFIVALVISIFLLGKDKTVTYTAQNSEDTITLPDNSVITLGADATISYNKNFNSKERIVNFSGYAHFNIESNPDKPFIINTNNMIVEVLGTEFDIEAHEGADKYIVNLFSGKVKMYSVDNEGNQLEQIVLLPGDRGIYDNSTQRIERKYQSSSNNSISSATDILDFNNVTLLAVTEALSEAYDIEIYLDNKYHNLRMTARFENETLESIFNTMAAIFNLQIVRIGNTVTIR